MDQARSPSLSFHLSSIEHDLPAYSGPVRWEDEGNRLMVSVQQDEQSIIDNAMPVSVYFFDRVASEPEPETAHMPVLPVLVCHLLAIGAKPRQVFHFGTADSSPLKELAPSQDGMLMEELDQ